MRFYLFLFLAIWACGIHCVKFPLACPLDECARYVDRGFSADHRAVDLNAPIGAAVYAADGGTIYRAGRDLNDGAIRVMVMHDDDVITGYWHLSAVAVSPGQQVRQGEIIGWVGLTGRTSWPHIHFFVIHKGEYVNPDLWVGLTVLRETLSEATR